MARKAQPVLLSLLGPSGSGKTLLATRLVEAWTNGGLSVGYAKHASHGFDMDRPGKDTDRVYQAGGAGVVVTGPKGTAFLDPREADAGTLAERFYSHCDAVVLEGFRKAALPAVVLAGPDGDAEFLSLAEGPVLALVASASSKGAADAATRGIARFEPDDGEALSAHLRAALGLDA
jgi:molybdopterin-guanine dinucleotide biosynthesis protein MobB